MSVWNKLQRFMNRPWYMALVAILAGLDLFILVIPTDGLLVTAVLAKRRAWVGRAIWVTTGSAFGALLLSWLLQSDVDWLTQNYFHQAFASDLWGSTEVFVDKYGVLALVFLALSIFPQQPGVVIAALAKMPLWEIFVAVWVGRAIKYFAFGWVAAFAPMYLQKIPFVRKELASFLGGGPEKSNQKKASSKGSLASEDSL